MSGVFQISTLVFIRVPFRAAAMVFCLTLKTHTEALAFFFHFAGFPNHSLNNKTHGFLPPIR
jgi:hypothetical protein